MDFILIVEDDASLAEGLCRALSAADVRAESCGTLAEAKIRLARWKQETMPLLLLDVNLPDGNGFDFLRTVKESYDISVIMLTANDMEMDIVAGLEQGADDYITKPFSLAVLRARVAAQLRRQHTLECGRYAVKPPALQDDFPVTATEDSMSGDRLISEVSTSRDSSATETFTSKDQFTTKSSMFKDQAMVEAFTHKGGSVEESFARKSKPAAAKIPVENDTRIIFDKYQFDFHRMQFFVDGQAVELSKTEQKLLRYLVENAGITLSRDTLIDRIWSDGAEFVDENALSVAVKRLRDKLSAQDHIKTVYGVGYVWKKEQ